jgi:hypothetical protein
MDANKIQQEGKEFAEKLSSADQYVLLSRRQRVTSFLTPRPGPSASDAL